MRTNKWSGRALAAALLTGVVFVGCDFISPVESDPNAVPEAAIDQLLVSVSVNTFFAEEGQSARLAALWIQQMAGTDRQFTSFDQYEFGETDAASVYDGVYQGGGLIDIRQAIDLTEQAGRRAYTGIFKVYEAITMGMTASLFGDIPYSEAVNPDVSAPTLDGQRSVYDAVLARLDDAILDLQSGEGAVPTAVDFVYAGDLNKWIAAANTLKARYNLHWVEVDGNGRYSTALTAAQNGILAPEGDWMADHGTPSLENNVWFQFLRDRSGYISAGAFLVDELTARSDPRLPVYYSEGSGTFAGQYVGSPPGNPAGDPGPDASSLADPGYGSSDWDLPILTCAENNFILAEAEFNVGTEGAARTALDAALSCEATRKGVDLAAAIDGNDNLTGAALLDEIMMQKYISLFLNREIWNDYKRTCLPAITPYGGQDVPGRLLYSDNARSTNPNVPAPSQQPVRNTNDPNPCP